MFMKIVKPNLCQTYVYLKLFYLVERMTYDGCVWGKQPLQWRHNGRDSVSNHQPHDCLLNRLSRRRSKKHQSPASLTFVTVEFPAQKASNAENVSIWWRHHD